MDDFLNLNDEYMCYLTHNRQSLSIVSLLYLSLIIVSIND